VSKVLWDLLPTQHRRKNGAAEVVGCGAEQHRTASGRCGSPAINSRVGVPRAPASTCHRPQPKAPPRGGGCFHEFGVDPGGKGGLVHRLGHAGSKMARARPGCALREMLATRVAHWRAAEQSPQRSRALSAPLIGSRGSAPSAARPSASRARATSSYGVALLVGHVRPPSTPKTASN